MADGGIAPARACAQCGSVFQLQLRYFNKMYCGRKCNVTAFRAAKPERYALYREREKNSDARLKRDALEKVVRELRRWGRKARAASVPTAPTNTQRYHAARLAKGCKQCGGHLRAGVLWQHRCDVCRLENKRKTRRAAGASRRAKLRSVEREWVVPDKVFERDGWRCHMCKRKTPKQLRGTYKPNAPELDHIVPLALGGSHTYRNTACCCRACNGQKGATAFGQPSLLALCA